MAGRPNQFDTVGQLNRLFADAPDFMFVANREHHLVFANRVAHGFTREQVIGQPAEMFVGEPFRDTVHAAIESVFTSGEPTRYETSLPIPDGSLLWFETRVIPVSADSDIEYVMLVANEITERVNTQRALDESEDRFRNIVTHSQPIIFSVDAAGMFTLSEGKSLAAIGLKPGEAVGQSAFEMYKVYPSIVQGIHRALGGSVAQETITVGESTFEFVMSPFHDADRRIIGLTGMAIDISETVKSRRAQQESEERYRELVESTADLVQSVDPSGRFLFVNRQWLETFGYAEDELPSLSLSDVVHPDSLEECQTVFERIVEEGEPVLIECDFMAKDGRRVPVRGNVNARTVEGNIIATHAFLRDVSQELDDEAERSRLAAQLQQSQKMEVIGQLTGGVAHDFNNLLTVIIGSLDLLRLVLPKECDNKVFHLVSQSLDASERAGALTQRLLAFARRQALQPRALDINALVDGMDMLLRRTLGETITISTRRAEGPWPCHADPTQLENVVLNLAINARDAMATGGELTIETSNVTIPSGSSPKNNGVPSGNYVQLSVTDTGVGMNPETIERAFEPFFTTKGVGQGSGLGLSMVYGFVKQSGGHVRISSALGQGTNIRVYLPRTDLVSEEFLDARPATATSSNGEWVLVVEDEERVRSLSVTLLDHLGYKIIAASSGQAALDLLDEHPHVDLLFTDVVLEGGMSGFQLAEKVRASHPDLKVLYASGYTETAIQQHARLNHDIDLVPKPFTLAELGKRVRMALDRD